MTYSSMTIETASAYFAEKTPLSSTLYFILHYKHIQSKAPLERLVDNKTTKHGVFSLET